MLFIGVNSFGQKDTKPQLCATDELIKEAIDKNPQLKSIIDLNEKMIQEMKSDVQTMRVLNQSSITIPVIVYVVHDGSSIVNISDAQVQSQLSALNNYFNPYSIKFCLATKTASSPSIPTPSGAIQDTPGIIHLNNNSLTDHIMNDSSQSQLQNATSGQSGNINFDKYLRVWVVKSINGFSSNILGYGTIPGINMPLDGIVMRYDSFGDINTCPNCNLLSGYDQGKALVHEVGHYFGLYHTFQNGCYGNTPSTCQTSGDYVCDTPQVATPNSGCPIYVNSCHGESPELPDLINNHMDYTNDMCRNEFTQGQKERMFSIMAIHRNTLYSAENLINSGVTCTPNLISANFTANSYTACINSANTITFSAVSAPGVSYFWNFGDLESITNTANTQTASHTYNSTINSPYTVTLTVTRISDGETASSTAEIFVDNCIPIYNSNSNWYTARSNMLKFNTGAPSFDLSFPETSHGYYNLTTQSDSSGNLLFYASKEYIWNANHEKLNIQKLATDSYNAQGINSIISVPNPGYSSKYTIFTNSDNHYNDQGFRYHIVNATSTNLATLGAIRQPITIPSDRGFLTSSIDGALIGGAGITAIKKCYDDDYWIITELKKNNGYFLVVYSFTNNPSNGGLTYVSEFQITSFNTHLNSLEASPNGDKLFMFVGLVSGFKSFIFDFNKISGIISDEKEIFANGVNGAAFSPDSKLLYTLDTQRTLNQYNLNSNNINNSKTVVNRLPFGKYFWHIQSGPDGKLYINTYPSKQLAVIHSPNALSTANNPNAVNLSLNGPTRPGGGEPFLGYGLPNMIDAVHSTVYPSTPTSISAYIVGCNTYKFFPDFCGTSFIWDFGDPDSGSNNTSIEANPTHIFSLGTLPLYNYTVKLKNSNNVVIAQTVITINNNPIELLGSTSGCVQNSSMTNHFTNIQDGETITWAITGGTGTSINPNNLSNFSVNWTSLPGIISLTVTNSAGCSKTLTQTITSDCNNQATCDTNLTFNNLQSTNSSHQASQNINANTNYTVNTGIDILLKAGNSIVISPNAHIKSGSTFRAHIGPCTQSNTGKNSSKKSSKINPSDVSIYPNPTSGILNIEVSNSSITEITLNSIDGKLIHFKKTANVNYYSLDLSSYEKGIYLLNLKTSEGEIIVKKIIKQ